MVPAPIEPSSFNTSQFEHAYPDHIERQYWHQARARIFARELRNSPGAQAPILEIGCGRGLVVKMLRARGFDCSGIELAPAEPEESVRSHVKAGARPEDLPPQERRRFKTLLFLDVLEHIDEPERFLRSTIELFPEAGTLLVAVPARGELWSNYDEYYHHLRRYDRPMVRALASKVGWEVLRARYAFRFLYPPVWALARMKRRRQVVLQAPAEALYGLHRMIGWLFSAEYHLLPGALPGTSLITVWRRK